MRRRKVPGLFKVVHDMLENTAFYYPETLPMRSSSPVAMDRLPQTPQYNRDDGDLSD